MTHERARDLLLDLSYGELPPGEAREVEHHLAGCDECAAEWRRLSTTRRALARLGDEPRDDGRRDAILGAARAATPAAIQAAPPGPSDVRPRRRARPRWAVAAMLAVATIVAGVSLKLGDLRPVDRVADLPAPKQDSGVTPAPLRERPPAAAAKEPPGALEGEPPRALRDEATHARREEAPGAGAEPPRAAGAAPRRSGAQASQKASRESEDLRSSASPEAPSRIAAQSGAARDPGAADGSLARGGAAAHVEERAEEQPVAAAAPEALAPSKSASPQPPRPVRAPPPSEHRAAALSLSEDDGRAAATDVAARVEDLAARGALTESTRDLTCAGARLRETSWSDAGVPLKLSLSSADGLSADGWYDQGGRLRSIRVTRRGVEQPLARRLLDERGRVLLDEGVDAAANVVGSRDAARAARWLPPRDPGSAPAEGCAPVVE